MTVQAECINTTPCCCYKVAPVADCYLRGHFKILILVYNRFSRSWYNARIYNHCNPRGTFKILQFCVCGDRAEQLTLSAVQHDLTPHALPKVFCLLFTLSEALWTLHCDVIYGGHVGSIFFLQRSDRLICAIGNIPPRMACNFPY